MFTVVGLRRIIPKCEGPQRRPTPCSWPLLLPGITQPLELCRLRKQIAPTALPQCKRPINRFCKTSHHQFDIARFKGGEDEQIGIWLNAGDAQSGRRPTVQIFSLASPDPQNCLAFGLAEKLPAIFGNSIDPY